ncbi:MAG: response regulator [Candidatus Methanospirareceae archaeon]
MRIRVLHVDDEPVDLEITRIFLKKEAKDDFEISSVLSAKEALAKLEKEHFDIIISDYKMPEMDGIQFLETLRKNKKYAHIPFILFTGKGNEKVKKEAFEKGADEYIPKNGGPTVQCSKLARAIRELVKKRAVKGEEEGVKVSEV